MCMSCKCNLIKRKKQMCIELPKILNTLQETTKTNNPSLGQKQFPKKHCSAMQNCYFLCYKITQVYFF